jgi:hypothetical protein
MAVEDDFTTQKQDITEKEYILDLDGKELDSDFQAWRQGNHVVVYILSRGGGRGTQMRDGKVIAAKRMRDSGLPLVAVLTVNAGQKIRYSEPPIYPTHQECIVRRNNRISIGNDENEWSDKLWKDAMPIAAKGPNNPDRPLHFYFETDRHPTSVLDEILGRRISIESNRTPATPRGRNAYQIDSDVLEGGSVYVLHNRSWSGWLKIGKAHDLAQRMRSYRTCQPCEENGFEYLAEFPHEKALKIELKTHDYLDEKLSGDNANQIRQGEWYKITLEQAVEAIEANWIGEFPL